MTERIDPKQLIDDLGVGGLCRTAEEYYKKITDPWPQMAKPFSHLPETPEMLCKLGALLAGLRLGKSMHVLDFGSGPCWLSRFLNQLQCSTVSVDPSSTALNLGKKLFEELPILGNLVRPPLFIPFDGHRIDIESESVDRIVCFDTFHHVPNQREVIEEFFRVLKPGGIAGFSEPGPNHSGMPQSQYEMKNYNVLENDIDLREIKLISEEVGFTDLYLKLIGSPDRDLSYNEFLGICFERTWAKRITRHLAWKKIMRHLAGSMEQSNVFFLVKGSYVADSRSHSGLQHHIETPKTHYVCKVNESIELTLTIRNTGSATWLHSNIQSIGVTNIGLHLYDQNFNLTDLDFLRYGFQEDIVPGQEVIKTVSLSLTQPGHYYIGVDLVSEYIGWFENFGSAPVVLEVNVE